MSRSAIYDAVLGALTLRQCRAANVTSNGRVIQSLRSDGQLGNLYGGPKDVRASWESEDVGGVAVAVAAADPFKIAVSAGTISIPWQKRADLGTFATGSNHYAVTGANGLIVPTEFRCEGDGNATVALEAAFKSTNGVAVPVSESATAALASSQVNAVYALGPIVITVGGVPYTFSDVAGLTVRTGVTMRPLFHAGQTYARQIVIQPPWVPVMEIRCYELGALLGSVGGWAAVDAVEAFLRKRDPLGTFVADNVAEHLKFSFADAIGDASIAGQGGDGDAMVTHAVTGLDLTIAANVAIA